MIHLRNIAALLTASALLMSCVLQPGKFDSTLKIGADRSFTFTYVGEVIAPDIGNEMKEGFSEGLKGKKDKDSDESEESDASWQDAAFDDKDAKKEKNEAKKRAIAAALAKEPGYRSVEYVGDDTFKIDYEISGVLTHNFVYPFNTDAEIVFPFMLVELRAKNRIRVKAPGFASDSDDSGMNPMRKNASKLDGTFTLITDAEIISQNNEEGYEKSGANKSITWIVSPLTKDAPLAVLQMN